MIILNLRCFCLYTFCGPAFFSEPRDVPGCQLVYCFLFRLKADMNRGPLGELCVAAFIVSVFV